MAQDYWHTHSLVRVGSSSLCIDLVSQCDLQSLFVYLLPGPPTTAAHSGKAVMVSAPLSGFIVLGFAVYCW